MPAIVVTRNLPPYLYFIFKKYKKRQLKHMRCDTRLFFKYTVYILLSILMYVSIVGFCVYVVLLITCERSCVLQLITSAHVMDLHS